MDSGTPEAVTQVKKPLKSDPIYRRGPRGSKVGKLAGENRILQLEMCF